MKKIIIALDYDPSAAQVATSGFEIAKAFNASVILLHVIDYPISYNLPFSVFGYESPAASEFDYSIGNMKKNAKEFLSSIAKKFGDKSTKVTVLEGNADDVIAAFASKHKASLAVVGSHRIKGLGRLLFSDTAAGVLRKIKTPLLTIPNA